MAGAANPAAQYRTWKSIINSFAAMVGKMPTWMWSRFALDATLGSMGAVTGIIDLASRGKRESPPVTAIAKPWKVTE
jgi:hypothetical protein